MGCKGAFITRTCFRDDKAYSHIYKLTNYKMNLSSFSDATVYVGGLDDKVSEAILWELFLQAGPVGKQAV